MAPSLDELVSFLEDFAFDSDLYLVVPTVDRRHRVELRWTRTEGFRLRPAGRGAWQAVASEVLEATLRRWSVDVPETTRQLTGTAMNQVVFAELVRSKAESLFGDDAVERALADNRAFLAQIRELVSGAPELTGRHLSSVPGYKQPQKNGDVPPPPAVLERRHLRLVSHDE